MNNEEMRKMWEEAAEQNNPKNASKNASKNVSHRTTTDAMKKDYEAYKAYKYKKSIGKMVDKIENGPKAAARKLQAEKDKPKTEETP